MAIKKFSPLLAENPLCGIGEYKDVLDLSTGGVTRRVKKYVFTGEENGTIYSTGTSRKGIEITGIPGIIGVDADIAILAICTHYQPDTRTALYRNTDNGISNSYQNNNIIFYDANYQTVDAFQQFCAQQYSNGTPVTIWYVLATPETETITIPSGLTGTIEGYLTQSGTPTPSTPIYPEANPALAWVPTTYRKFGIETKTITSLPAQIIGDGQPITSCQISGNTTQSGTPTPDNPIMPQGTGERTNNLCPMIFSHTGVVDDNGSTGSYDTRLWSDKIPVSASQSYYVVVDGTASNGEELSFNRIIQYDANGVFISRIIVVNLTSTAFTTSANCRYVVLDIRTRTLTVNISVSDINALMLNTGSTPFPYEPYGYKLPMTVNGTEYPIYLGQVETTRRIKKLVLTGEEGWARTQNQRCYYINASTGCPTDYLKQTITTSICSHYQSQNNTASGSNGVEAGHFCFYTGGFELYIGETTISSVADFKSYLQQQYTNGTPVTVWYVLKKPETGIVNEPLMKIGDYADTISATNIPTTGTPENFDVGTTLKPSEVSLTYHGWHEHTDTKYTQGE